MCPKPLRVLHVIGAMNRGGAETLIMNLYRNINRERIQFDFLVNEMGGYDYDEEIGELGGRMFAIPRYNIANYPVYRRACQSFFSSHHYPIVHGHIGLPAPIYLSIAREHGAKCIAHSHAQNYPLSASELVFRIATYPTRYRADYFMACSLQAGEDRYGKDVVRSDRFHVLKNGIDIERTRFEERNRAAIRQELGLDSKTPLFGHVGRLTHIKNQTFLLKVFARILDTLPSAHLVLVGRGEDEADLRAQADALGISGHVHLLGVRSDVPSILSALDVFIFPSHKEGLANATVEAQASGAHCLLSTGVPELARISPNTVFKPLDAGAEAWAAQAIDLYRHPTNDRASAVLAARQAGFDIKDSATWLSDFYLALDDK